MSPAASDRILVFIPAYRCAAQIGRVLRQFAEPAIHQRFEEILVLDNRSPDDTLESALNAARSLSTGKITVARNRANLGLGGSHKAAFAHAIREGFTHVAVLHGDDQGCIADLVPVLAAGQHLDFDCCLGARFHPKASLSGYSAVRRLGNRAFNALFSLAGGRRLHDLGSGLNLYRTDALRGEYWRRFDDSLMFNYCMILGHLQRHDRIMFFPITWREDDQISNVRLFSQAWRTLGILGRYVRRPGDFLATEFRAKPDATYAFDVIESDL